MYIVLQLLFYNCYPNMNEKVQQKDLKEYKDTNSYLRTTLKFFFLNCSPFLFLTGFYVKFLKPSEPFVSFSECRLSGYKAKVTPLTFPLHLGFPWFSGPSTDHKQVTVHQFLLRLLGLEVEGVCYGVVGGRSE